MEPNLKLQRVLLTSYEPLPADLMIGPMDYTPGGFRNVTPEAFRITDDLPFVQTTRARMALALYVAFLSPVAAVSDSPDTCRQPRRLRFHQGSAGELGRRRATWPARDREYIVLASARDAGSSAPDESETARKVTVPLDFGSGRGAAMRLLGRWRQARRDLHRKRVAEGRALTLDRRAWQEPPRCLKNGVQNSGQLRDSVFIRPRRPIARGRGKW